MAIQPKRVGEYDAPKSRIAIVLGGLESFIQQGPY